MLTITIKQGKEKSLLQGDCLIYLSAIDKVDGKPGERMQSGATALVQTSSGQFLARAGFSPKSQTRLHVSSSVSGLRVIRTRVIVSGLRKRLVSGKDFS